MFGFRRRPIAQRGIAAIGFVMAAVATSGQSLQASANTVVVSAPTATVTATVSRSAGANAAIVTAPTARVSIGLAVPSYGLYANPQANPAIVTAAAYNADTAGHLH